MRGARLGCRGTPGAGDSAGGARGLTGTFGRVQPPPLGGLKVLVLLANMASVQDGLLPGRRDGAPKQGGLKMLLQEAPARSSLRITACSICGKSVRVNPLKASDTDVICRMCRCKRCSIPISPRPCDRCGVAHGTPSVEPGLCEQCFVSTDHSDAVSAEPRCSAEVVHAGIM